MTSQNLDRKKRTCISSKSRVIVLIWIILLLLAGCTLNGSEKKNTDTMARQENGKEKSEGAKENPVFKGVEDIYVVRGAVADYDKNIQAFGSTGEELTEEIQIDASQVILDECGEYPLIYRVEDSQGNKNEVICTVHVLEGEGAVPIILKERETAFVRVCYQNGEEISRGSGFIIEKNEQGIYIMTNGHVVGEETDVEIFFYDGSNVWGKVLGRKEEPDMAVVKVEKNRLKDAKFTQLNPLEIDLSHWDSLNPDKLPAAGYRCLNTDGSLWIEEIGRLSKKQENTWISEYPLVQYTMENKKGASGSAIIDESGKLIAMALGVSEEGGTKAFWGIGLPDIMSYYEEITGSSPGY